MDFRNLQIGVLFTYALELDVSNKGKYVSFRFVIIREKSGEQRLN